MSENKPDLDLTEAVWQGSCEVQIAFVEGYIVMRNGVEPDGPTLTFTPDEWRAFVLGARDGEFDVQAAPEPAEKDKDIVALGIELDRIEREEGPDAVEAYLREHEPHLIPWSEVRGRLVTAGILPADNRPADTII